jgi:2-polyprenyl-3-methyl-5-hydroxy-6-metoxy-1,4-benzoquinol methylase
MNSDESILPERTTAYTTPRPDVFAMVPPSAMAILDVGCSNGALGASLRAARDGRKVFGVEIDAVFAEEARSCLDHVACTDVNHFDWSAFMPGQSFDCIIFADVLEHLIAPDAHLQAAGRRLTDGGCIVVSLPNIRHLSSLRSIFLQGTFPRRDRGIFDRTHLRWFTLRDARKMIEFAGMRVEANSYALRWGDIGGGRVNRVINRLLPQLQRLSIVREFLTYQFCLRAVAVK